MDNGQWTMDNDWGLVIVGGAPRRGVMWITPSATRGSSGQDLTPNPSPQERGVCHAAREGVWGASPSPVERDLGRGLKGLRLLRFARNDGDLRLTTDD